MPRQRVQTEARIPAATFDPIIAPWAPTTDTYVRPRAGTKLAQLAEGLSALAPSLARFSDVAHDNWTDEQRAAAEAESAEALRQGAKDYNDAVKRGLIRRDQNPHYRAYAEAQFGQAAAEMAAAEIGRRVNAELAESTNPEDFDKVAQEVITGFAPGEENQNRFFQHAFNRTIQGVVANGRSQFYAQAGARYQKKATETYEALTAQTVQTLAATATVEQLATTLQARLDDVVLSGGGDPSMLNEATLKASVASALALGGPEGRKVLAALDKLVSDKKSGALLTKTAAASEMVRQAREQLGNIDEARKAEEKRVVGEKIDAVTTPLLSELVASAAPMTVNIQPAVQALRDIGTPESIKAANDLIQTQMSLDKRSNEDGEEEWDEITTGVWDGKYSESDLKTMLRNGVIGRALFNYGMAEYAQREDRAYTRSQRAKAAAGGGGEDARELYKEAMSDPMFTKERTEFEAAIGVGVSDINKAVVAEAARGVLAKLDVEWVNYVTGPGRNASPQDRRVWIQRRATQLRREAFANSGGKTNRIVMKYNDEATWRSRPVMTRDEYRSVIRFISEADYTDPFTAELLEFLGATDIIKARNLVNLQSPFME